MTLPRARALIEAEPVKFEGLTKNPDKNWVPQEFLACMGFDAMRLALGKPTMNFTKDEVMLWIRCINPNLA